MSKRKVDPTTGEPRLTYREQRFLDEFITNGGNGFRAAASAGYSPARPGQSAYQVLRRPEVQRRIAQRIAESRVIADSMSSGNSLLINVSARPLKTRLLPMVHSSSSLNTHSLPMFYPPKLHPVDSELATSP